MVHCGVLELSEQRIIDVCGLHGCLLFIYYDAKHLNVLTNWNLFLEH